MMSDDCQAPKVKTQMRVIQVITLAILGGATMFAFVVATMVDWENVSSLVKLMTLIGALTGLSMYGLSFVIPGFFISSTSQATALDLNQDSIDDAALVKSVLTTMTTSHVIFSAIVEGAIFLNLITFLLERSYLSAAIVLIGFVLLVLTFPFTSRLQGKLADQIQSIKDEQKLLDRSSL